ncbi:hypothetical protein P3G67_20450 [Streptomyces sp. RB6PN23]|uniref:Uncharacterized protein n=1 Tax=Streptomyces silvisoli TaxID=3034235 RepID=A0ABT5ZNZ6_9ACTN|nr:hypothetical protein [Streptomyces silvisoli]MDF3291555.1 hypothetical protein [Streptomyces silvisoli]
MTTDDVVHANYQIRLRLGEPPSPVPEPFAELLLAWIDNRDNMNTAANRDSRWLFPGRRAGAMTVRRPCPPAPGLLEEYAARFDDLFVSLAQRHGFREYLTAC